MNYDVEARPVLARRLAVVRDRVRWAELGKRLIPLLDRVYVAVRAGKVIQSGQNIFVYREASRDSVAVEVGVEVSGSFEPSDGVVCSETPRGAATVTTHKGPYSELGKAHEAVIRWCREQGHKRAGVWWEGDAAGRGQAEVEVDWHDDPAKLETEVYYLVQPAEK